MLKHSSCKRKHLWRRKRNKYSCRWLPWRMRGRSFCLKEDSRRKKLRNSKLWKIRWNRPNVISPKCILWTHNLKPNVMSISGVENRVKSRLSVSDKKKRNKLRSMLSFNKLCSNKSYSRSNLKKNNVCVTLRSKGDVKSDSSVKTKNNSVVTKRSNAAMTRRSSGSNKRKRLRNRND